MMETTEPAPFELFRNQVSGSALLVCDHASNRIPPGLAGLGLGEADLTRHIAWDIGAGALCREMALRLGVSAVLGTVSRLVIDCNRIPGSPTSICEISDGTKVPGNQGLSPEAAKTRESSWYIPYHSAIEDELVRLDVPGAPVALISVHSFTPVMADFSRPWPIAILWDRDPRLPVPMIEALRARGLQVGDNEPYSERGHAGEGGTLHRHCTVSGRANVAIEVRQDEIADQPGVLRWAEILSDVLAPLLKRPEMRERKFFDPIPPPA